MVCVRQRRSTETWSIDREDKARDKRKGEGQKISTDRTGKIHKAETKREKELQAGKNERST